MILSRASGTFAIPLLSILLLASLLTQPPKFAVAQENGNALETPDPFLGWRSGELVLWDGRTSHSLMRYSWEKAKAGGVVLFKGYLFYLDDNALKRLDLDSGKTTTIDPSAIDTTFRSGSLSIDHDAFAVVFNGQGPRRTDCTEEPYCSLDDDVDDVVMTKEIRIRARESNYIHMPFPRERFCSWDGRLQEGISSSLKVQSTNEKWTLKGRIRGDLVTILSTKNPIPEDCKADSGSSPESIEIQCQKNSRSPSAICSLFTVPCDQRAFGKCVSFDLRNGQGEVFHEGMEIEGFNCPIGDSPSGCWTSGSRRLPVGPVHFGDDTRFIHWIR